MKITLELDDSKTAALPPLLVALLPVLLDLLKKWLEARPKGDLDVSPNP